MGDAHYNEMPQVAVHGGLGIRTLYVGERHFISLQCAAARPARGGLYPFTHHVGAHRFFQGSGILYPHRMTLWPNFDKVSVKISRSH